MKNSCDVIQDLFVPYLDDTCSEESRRLLNEHLESCEKCKKHLKAINSHCLKLICRAISNQKSRLKKLNAE
jgi:predicted anti-sigma-YlaC factor YlaD